MLVSKTAWQLKLTFNMVGFCILLFQSTNSSIIPQDLSKAITVGDRVTVEDCPGHWSWASSFTVQAIEGEMAKLEMVDELIEMSLLEKCC
jgi:hypothetical protein